MSSLLPHTTVTPETLSFTALSSTLTTTSIRRYQQHLSFLSLYFSTSSRSFHSPVHFYIFLRTPKLINVSSKFLSSQTSLDTKTISAAIKIEIPTTIRNCPCRTLNHIQGGSNPQSPHYYR